MTAEALRTLARRALLRDVDISTAPPFIQPDAVPSQVIRLDSDDVPFIGDAVCTIGAFDGVHRGHRFLFSSMLNDAHERNLPSVIVTFDPDPDELFLSQNDVYKLLNNHDRIEFLRRFSADYVVCVPFTYELAANTAQSFIDDVLGACFRPRAIHVGSDFRLGAGNEGNVAALSKLGARSHAQCDVHGYNLLCHESEPVSATRIRHLLMHDGDCAQASKLLCRPHFIRGHVVSGRHEGTSFGFPTANVEIDYPYVIPAEGVYCGFVGLEDDMVWPSAINVGIPRTFAQDDKCASIEAHLLGYSGDLYQTQICVAFTEHLRRQQSFLTLDDLIATVQSNIASVADALGSSGCRL